MSVQLTTERLLDLARAVRQGGSRLVVSDGLLTDTDFARIKLALKLLDAPATAFKLLLEEAELGRIVEEVY